VPDIIEFENLHPVDLLVGNCLDILPTLPEKQFQTCVTSPPYFGLRDYGGVGQIGMEQTPEAYVAQLVTVFHEVWRVLRDDGTVWLNIGDSYANGGRTSRDGDGKLPARQMGVRPLDGAKPKDLLMIPARVALALQADGWWLRSAIVWHKPNPMPESVKDRPTSAYEMVFLLAKSEQYYYDADAIAEVAVTKDRPKEKLAGESAVDAKTRGTGNYCVTSNGRRNARNVWSIIPQPFKGAHFAVMAPELARRCILAGCPEGGLVIDPFGGAGTTGLVAGELRRRATLIELNPIYADIARERMKNLAAQ